MNIEIVELILNSTTLLFFDLKINDYLYLMNSILVFILINLVVNVCSRVNFGETFTFSPLNDFCVTDYEKTNAKLCLKYYPDDWNCIYENCISLSRTQPYYIHITLPPIKNNRGK